MRRYFLQFSIKPYPDNCVSYLEHSMLVNIVLHIKMNEEDRYDRFKITLDEKNG